VSAATGRAGGGDLGIGIIGAGTIGAVHARELATVDGARVVAVADPTEAAGRALADAHGAAWHPGIEEVVARDDVDAVVLCTPSGLHPEGAEVAAAAGRHVITEKPMAITLDGVDRMIGACRDAGVALCVIFQYRFNRDAVLLKRAVEQGLLGDLVLGNALVHWHRTQAYYDDKGGWRGTWAMDGGGALMNQSVHAVDLLQWILGPVDSVFAYTATAGHAIETEDLATAALRFRSGAVGMIQGTTCAHRNYPLRLELRGTAGGATFEQARITEWDGPDPGDLLSADELERLPPAEPDEGLGPGHRRQLQVVVDALRDGGQPPIPSSDARTAVEIILAVYRSAAEGRPVQL
jgi:predicted dehydrogenase